MAEIVNLKKARKAKARADDQQAAAANRALHGRTKAERIAEREAKAKAANTHEGHKREKD